MEEEILHKGKILQITPQYTTVEIISRGACAACHAKSLCAVGESSSKIIELPTRAWENREVGEEVTVSLKASMGHKAVWLAYVIPLLVLLAVLMTMLLTGQDELVSGICALSSIGVYYFILWLFRDKLRSEYIFNLKQ